MNVIRFNTLMPWLMLSADCNTSQDGWCMLKAPAIPSLRPTPHTLPMYLSMCMYVTLSCKRSGVAE